MYQVTAEFVANIPTWTPDGRVLTSFYRGAYLPESVDQKVLDHLLSMGMVELVPGTEPVAPEAPATPDPTVAPIAPEIVSDEEQAKRDEAKAKLPEDGSAPHHNAAKAVWVEYAVEKGYARDEADKSTKDELIALLTA